MPNAETSKRTFYTTPARFCEDALAIMGEVYGIGEDSEQHPEDVFVNLSVVMQIMSLNTTKIMNAYWRR
jgi:hypothetical protein